MRWGDEMAREKDLVKKDESLASVVRVQEVIDYFVLSNLHDNGSRYQSQMEQNIIETLSGVGVNKAYLINRLRKLTDAGHVSRKWDSDERYNRYYYLTEEGLNYLKKIMNDLPARVKRAQKVYKLFEEHMNNIQLK